MSEGGFYQWVAVIGGYPSIVTDGDTDEAVTAWAGSPYSQALPGLVVDLDLAQELDAYDPIRSGPSGRLWIQPDGVNTLRKAMHRTDVGAKTYLADTGTIDRDDTTITVLSTAAFPPAPDEACIGNETFSYSGKTATQFTGCVRGLYAAFARDDADQRFADHHRAGNVDYGVPLNPIVSQYHRTWQGRWVGVYLHKKAADGTLSAWDSADTLRVFAGQIAEIAIDKETGWTVIDLDHVLDYVRNQTVMRDQFKGRLAEGVYLPAGGYFTLTEVTSGSGDHETAHLVVVPGAPGSVNEIQEGYYSAEDLRDKFNAWLAAELGTGNILGTYVCAIKLYDDGPRFAINWSINTTTGGEPCFWEISMPQTGAMVAEFLGLTGGHIGSGARWFSGHVAGVGDEHYDDNAGNPPAYHGGEAPFRLFFGRLIGGDRVIDIEETAGTFVDATAALPGSLQVLADLHSGATNWGLFDIGGVIRVFGSWVAGLGSLNFATPIAQLLGDILVEGTWDSFVGQRLGEGDDPIEIKQILCVGGSFSDVVQWIFASTGTPGYNEATLDVLGYGGGIAIPWALLGDSFTAALENLPSADTELLVLVDKPTKLVDLIKGDLLVRRAHLIYKEGALRFVSWSTPTITNAAYTLTEASKARPEGSQESFRSGIRTSADWARPILKLFYNRTSSGDYAPPFVIEDRSAIDDASGGGEAVEIPLRNVYGATTNIADLFPALVAWHAFFSRPIRIIERSIDLSLMLSICPGDIIALDDNDVPDPRTGDTGVSSLPCLVVKVRTAPPGPTPGDPDNIRAMVGEVTLAYLELQDTAPYAPAAEIDETQDSGNYDAGYDDIGNSLYCKQHVHSETTAVHDAARFAAGDEILIVEIDPEDPTAPTKWVRVIDHVTGDEIFLTSALSSPAWDHDKQYRVTSTLYADATATQHGVGSYQADADGDIQDDAGPYLYGDDTLGATYTADSHTDYPERSADIAAVDGAPRDTGYERGLMRMINGLVDHKTAPNLAVLGSQFRAGSGFTGTWQIHSITPWNVGDYELLHHVRKAMHIAPFIKSTDGSSTSCRVSLCTLPPTGDSYDDATLQGLVLSATYATTDAVGEIPTLVALTLTMLNGNPNECGLLFLVIEYKDKCSILGIGEAIVRERTT